MNEPVKEKHCPKYSFQHRDYKKGKEHEIFSILTKVFAENWNDIETWRWKHCNRPGFQARDIVTTHIDNKMVGCFHSAVLPLKIEPGIIVPMSFDGDFAIIPKYRGKDVPSMVHDLTDKKLKETGVALRGGFTSKMLNELFYHRQFGYVFVPTESTNFRKIVGINALRRKVESLGEKFLSKPSRRQAIAGPPIIVNFDVEGFEPFHVIFSENAFQLNNSFSNQAKLHIKSPYSVIMNLALGIKPLIKSILVNFFRGKLRVRGLFKIYSRLFQLLRNTMKLR